MCRFWMRTRRSRSHRRELREDCLASAGSANLSEESRRERELCLTAEHDSAAHPTVSGGGHRPLLSTAAPLLPPSLLTGACCSRAARPQPRRAAKASSGASFDGNLTRPSGHTRDFWLT